MTWQTSSTGSNDTERLGGLLGELLKTPGLVELRSDLGGGKTIFVRGLARGFGSRDTVSSPSFTLNKVYKSKRGEIHHFDFYRLAEAGVMAAQLAESVGKPGVVTVVEWGGVVQDVLPKERLTIEFKPLAKSEDSREIVIHYPESMSELIKQLETNWTEIKP